MPEYEDREQIVEHLGMIERRTRKLVPTSQSWSDLTYLLSLTRRLLPPADDVMG